MSTPPRFLQNWTWSSAQFGLRQAWGTRVANCQAMGADNCQRSVFTRLLRMAPLTLGSNEIIRCTYQRTKPIMFASGALETISLSNALAAGLHFFILPGLYPVICPLKSIQLRALTSWFAMNWVASLAAKVVQFQHGGPINRLLPTPLPKAMNPTRAKQLVEWYISSQGIRIF